MICISIRPIFEKVTALHSTTPPIPISRASPHSLTNSSSGTVGPTRTSPRSTPSPITKPCKKPWVSRESKILRASYLFPGGYHCGGGGGPFNMDLLTPIMQWVETSRRPQPDHRLPLQGAPRYRWTSSHGRSRRTSQRRTSQRSSRSSAPHSRSRRSHAPRLPLSATSQIHRQWQHRRCCQLHRRRRTRTARQSPRMAGLGLLQTRLRNLVYRQRQRRHLLARKERLIVLLPSKL